ncbi:MAG: SUMF1/EgtB/PvdO family nonheme iron enzyme [Treponema sp.]|jgi:formylglycine-generating enzyme required for sulfatase activity|nr:SUMF1/EgtB/PvdO family nonheme iron enzyme [Treponema sp.]
MKKKMLYMIVVVSLFLSSCPQPTGVGLEPPAVPAAPALRPGNNKLILSWPAVRGADSYEVFCGKTETGVSLAQTVNVPAAAISGLENGTTYYLRLRAKNSAGTSGFSPSVTGEPALQLPSPSLIRGDTRLSISWAAEDGVNYEVWYGVSGDHGAAGKWAGPVTSLGITAAATITGLANGTAYHVWIKAFPNTESETGGFGAETTGIPEAAPASVPENFVYVPGGTVTGSDGCAFTVTVPTSPAGYTGAGTSSIRKGVFVEGRRADIDSFVMATYETTRQLWYEVQSWAVSNGYHFQNNPVTSAPSETVKNKPLTGISWRDAIVWCNAYSEMRGKQPVYYLGVVPANVIRDSRDSAACDGAVMDKTKTGYRLPTEAEREFAARGGNPANAAWLFMYAGSDNADAAAWHHGNSPYLTRAVGGKAANTLGIFDLSGNAQEWCWDWMNWAVDVTPSTPVDGAAYSAAANQKAFNGGGVGSNITYSCVSYRWGYTSEYTNNYVGFRVVCKP